ncbi:TRAP transporter substrate-binding protein [Polymorphum gilvum]|uniref:Peptide ABC transporter, solute-binding protein n=1 Tax=Polymorphum gilvum (strain LMG 25793 / CGMCC 1.9160 / SL003B-26A1) TaxID=991905 RepID=F2J1G9_POLGS|nr:TRAP transporter substrate-binding protein [Polymorphum gilvum]ADZ69751.1 Peptide ABC transporter, solute-binding protein [Polymorphum gilvum SL003B-26A1]
MTRTLKSGILTTVSAAAFAAVTATAAVAAEKWDMPMAYPATNFHSENAATFAACVTAGTGGEIEIVTHPGGSLFGGADIKRAVQTGQVPIGERLLSAHANENPLFGIDSIPFLATSFDDAVKLWTAAEPAIAEALDEQNLVLLYTVPWPPQGFYFNMEVNSVAAMKGVKFRAYNAATAKLAELTGMLPVQIEAAEISQAFATGVAQAMISSGATGYDSKLWENVSHFYEVDAWLPRNAVFVNKDTWAGLSDAAKTTLTDCAATAASDGLQKAKDYTQFTLDGLKSNGMQVLKPSEQLKSDLKAIGETMTSEWLASAGDKGKAIVDAYKSM